MRIETDVKLDFDDVLIRPKRSTLKSRKEVYVMREFTFLHSREQFSGVPIMAANMDTVGTIELANVLAKHSMFTCLHKYIRSASSLFWSTMNAAPTIGITDDDLDWLEYVKPQLKGLKYVCIDVANGYTERFIDFVKTTRHRFPEFTIIAGNVCTPEITEELILAGADIVKVGIGPGSACTTRIQTGIGYPQLSAVIECADAAHGLKGHIISDGGCRVPGDVVKAFAAGADFVMIGGMLAGHQECGGEIETDLEGKKWMKFYGMSSRTAQEKHLGKKETYRASEGRTIMVPFKPDLNETIEEILGGLRSACTYVGAAELKELPKRATFIMVNNTHNKVFERETVGD